MVMLPLGNATPTTDWTSNSTLVPPGPKHTTTDAEHVVVVFAAMATKHALRAIHTTHIVRRPVARTELKVSIKSRNDDVWKICHLLAWKANLCISVVRPASNIVRDINRYQHLPSNIVFETVAKRHLGLAQKRRYLTKRESCSVGRLRQNGLPAVRLMSIDNPAPGFKPALTALRQVAPCPYPRKNYNWSPVPWLAIARETPRPQGASEQIPIGPWPMAHHGHGH